MTNLEDSAKILSEFGLTPYESKVYLTVFQQGLTTAADIAKVAGIRREEVYRTLPKLEKTGLVEKVLGRPAKVRALPIDDALSILINRKEEEASRVIRNLLEKRNELLEIFQEVKPDILEVKDKSHFTLLSEKDAIEKRISHLIKQATDSIDFADTFESAFRFVLTFADELMSARKRNVDVRIITEYPDSTKLIPDAFNKHVPTDSFNIRYCEDLPGNYIVFDSYQALITTAIGSSVSTGGTLWTNDPSLVKIVHTDFDSLLGTSIDWKDLKVTSDEKLMRILKNLKPRDHVILFYESVEAKRNTLFSYINRGLIDGKAGAYICSEETPDEIRSAMNEFGIDVTHYEENGALHILHYTEVYIRDGLFDLDFVMDTWNKRYNDAITKGFKGMRVTGEMSCFIDHDLVDELIEYEHALHTVLEIPMTAICAYNADKLTDIDNPVDVYSELVKAHGKVLFAGKDSAIGKIEVRAG
ncbi:MAG: MEDS domain-containing protein [Candidatus Thorarchaeota archaeon]